MNAEVVKLPEKKPEKSFKPRLEMITPAHIVDSWKLLERSIRETGGGYPDLSEERPEIIRAHLFNLIASPRFLGLMLKVGKKPVGQIIGQVVDRGFGRPKQAMFIWNFWIEPEYRKKGGMDLLYKAYFERMRKAGVFYWEADATDELTALLTSYGKYQTKKLMNRIGGKV